jgi:hypothetical protein
MDGKRSGTIKYEGALKKHVWQRIYTPASSPIKIKNKESKRALARKNGRK